MLVRAGRISLLCEIETTKVAQDYLVIESIPIVLYKRLYYSKNVENGHFFADRRAEPAGAGCALIMLV